VNRLILGTAGHIDHGKTALVHALTGVDTDRLPEEKSRGITIDLGFAELVDLGGLQVGVVDVPGHEDFVRTMVAGASGMDLVLLVVAADEGVMPQTREHLDIVRLLDVPAMVVALTKTDAAEADFAELVAEEVRELLSTTGYADAPIIATSARTGAGLDELREALGATARGVRRRADADLARLPVDRVFTVAGRGTVVTGTLWSGALSVGASVNLLPRGATARIRSAQVHGRDVDAARAGERTAVALAGVDRQDVERGAVLVNGPGWAATWMLTARVRVLPGQPHLEQGQRVRVHLGTAEVLARVATLQEGAVADGAEGWVQLRLERPTVARAGDRLVLRRYSPLATLGGGRVAEPCPPKRRRLEPPQVEALTAVLDGTPSEAVHGVLALAGWEGASVDGLATTTGRAPAVVEEALAAVTAAWGAVGRGVAFGPAVVADARNRILEALDRGHHEEPLRPSVSLDLLRAAVPDWAAGEIVAVALARLQEEGVLELAQGGARTTGFEPRPTEDQERACQALTGLYRDAGLAAPFLDDLPEELRGRSDLGELLRFLERHGVVRTIDDGLMVAAEALDAAARAVTERLGGRTGLGPADFREVLDVSRRHLMALLAHFDGLGVTLRRGPARDVPVTPQ
jgi:selenocysteine-specific elongation factor